MLLLSSAINNGQRVIYLFLSIDWTLCFVKSTILPSMAISCSGYTIAKWSGGCLSAPWGLANPHGADKQPPLHLPKAGLIVSMRSAVSRFPHHRCAVEHQMDSLDVVCALEV